MNELTHSIDNFLDANSELFFDEEFMMWQRGCIGYSTRHILKIIVKELSKYNVKIYFGHLNSKLWEISSNGRVPIVMYTNTNLIVKISDTCFRSSSAVYVSFYTNDKRIEFGGNIMPDGSERFHSDTSQWASHFEKLVTYVDPRIYADYISGGSVSEIQSWLLSHQKIERTKNDLHRALENIQLENALLSDANQKVIQEIEKLKRVIDEGTKKYDCMERKLFDETEKWTKKETKHHEYIKSLQQEKDELKRRCEFAECRLFDAKNDSEIMRHKYEELSCEKEGLNTENEELCVEIARLSESNKKIMNAKQLLECEREKLTVEIVRLLKK
jgi:predicted  nucleic acid-binding Zn-ribbon protein